MLDPFQQSSLLTKLNFHSNLMWKMLEKGVPWRLSSHPSKLLIVINLISKSAEHLKLLEEISTGTADTKFLLWRVRTPSKSLRGAGQKKTSSTFLPNCSEAWGREIEGLSREQVWFLAYWESAEGLSLRQGDSDITDGTAWIPAHRSDPGGSFSCIDGGSWHSSALRG